LKGHVIGINVVFPARKCEFFVFSKARISDVVGFLVVVRLLVKIDIAGEKFLLDACAGLFLGLVHNGFG
jgi:hypothetical protein